ncbi:geranylgeranyl reductase family protein [Nitrospira sp. BLG_2]|uniref:geranylgeranyl reductase family protein n=1 Tax=Nitrospira sp. BLG_2 TaxID=3397507 RepID=UPI003B9D785D
MNSRYDVIVVGSGPAGACAAWRLAKAGVSVAVLEKAALPRYKTCGGGLVGRAMQALPVEVRQVIEQDCYTARLNILPAGLSFTTHRQMPIVSMTMRSQFDFAILSAAQEAGAAVHQRCAVENVSFHGDFVTLATSAESMRAKFIVAADGAISTVARKMGLADGRILIPALEYEVTMPHDRLDRFHGTARFDVGLIPHGYAWVFPKKTHLSIGVLSMAQRERDLKGAMARYLDLLGCGALAQVERHGFVIPSRPRRGPFAERRILLVGDAAGFADPVTGEGISFAIRSGLLAAQALIDGQLDEELVRNTYNGSVTESILPELQRGGCLARLLYTFPRMRWWAFSQHGQILSEAVTDVMAGKKQYRDLTFKPRTLLRLLSPRWLRNSAYRPARPHDDQV